MKKNNFVLKKLFLLVFSAALVFSSCHRASDSNSEILQNIPQIGRNSGNFTVKDIQNYIGNTKLVLFEHERTGAKILYIANDDTQRGFNIGFRTFAKDNKGLPHVFEHATLAGNEKYPSSNLLFQMMEQTYSTYINAVTTQYATFYPSSSLSEEQLLVNFDYYLNGLKSPFVLKDERAMNREAYRYVLENPEDEISATGAVYSEMKGKNSISTDAYYNNKQFMFPNSAESFITGGKPEDILKITWQELKDFHNLYYHPSNMLCVLYGKLDYERFLAKLEEEYLSGFEKKEIRIEDSLHEPWTGYREKTFDFPANKGSRTENQSIIQYNILIDDETYYNSEIIGILMSSVLNKDSSWIKTKLREKLPNARMGFYYSNSGLYQYLNFSFSNVDEKDKDFLKKLCDEALEQLSKDGIGKNIFEECVLAQKFDLIFENEDSKPISKMNNFVLTWGASGNPLNMQECIRAIFDIGKFEDSTIVQDFIKNKVFTSKQKSLTVTRPVPGLAEEMAEKEKKFFSDKKSSMSEKEITELVQYTKDFKSWSEENEKINLIDKVKAVSVQDLPEEAEEISVDEKNLDGIRVLTSDIGNVDYFKSSLYFDASVIPQDMILDFILFSKLMESVPTKSHNLQELENKFYTTFHYSIEGALTIKYKEGGYNPYFYVDFMTLNEKISDSWSLIEEILFDSEFTDYNLIRSVAGRIANSKKQGWLSDPSTIAATISDIAANNSEKLYEYNNFLFNLVKYFSEVSKMNDSQLEEVVKKIQNAKNLLLNKNGMIFTCAGSKNSIEENLKNLRTFSEKLSSEKNPRQDYVFEPLPKNIAIAVTSNAAFNFEKISNKDAGYEEVKGDMLPFGTFIGDKFLLPTLRFKMGAYGTSSYMGRDGVTTYSYRDPNVKSSFEIFSQIPDFLKNSKFTQDDFDGYITSTYSSFAMPVPKRSLAESTFSSILSHNYEKERKVRLMKEMKTFGQKSIDEYIKFYENQNENSVKVTAANFQTINENKELFDLVITDLME